VDAIGGLMRTDRYGWKNILWSLTPLYPDFRRRGQTDWSTSINMLLRRSISASQILNCYLQKSDHIICLDSAYCVWCHQTSFCLATNTSVELMVISVDFKHTFLCHTSNSLSNDFDFYFVILFFLAFFPRFALIFGISKSSFDSINLC